MDSIIAEVDSNMSKLDSIFAEVDSKIRKVDSKLQLGLNHPTRVASI